MMFVFRTDASKNIGTGHVMRCLSLAGALKEKGADVLFICRELEGNLCNLIEEEGFIVSRLPVLGEVFVAENNPEYSDWLGVGWKDDAEYTASIIRESGIQPDWLIIDHYGLDIRWEQFLRSFTERIFVIDDLADRNHDCDLLLDQNLVADMQNRYLGKVPENCKLLLGPKYALLQPIYAELHDRIPPREGKIERILISFGGADSDNLTGRALSAFISLNRPDIDVDVIVENSSYKTAIQELVAGFDNIRLHGTVPTLAPLMVKADLAIGAAGTTSWERLCLGLPAVVVTLAENQRAVAKNLNDLRLIHLVGNKKEVNNELIGDSIGEIINCNYLFEWSSNCMMKCDGRGIKRVVELIMP